jgi:hypothetical protein
MKKLVSTFVVLCLQSRVAIAQDSSSADPMSESQLRTMLGKDPYVNSFDVQKAPVVQLLKKLCEIGGLKVTFDSDVILADPKLSISEGGRNDSSVIAVVLKSTGLRAAEAGPRALHVSWDPSAYDRRKALLDKQVSLKQQQERQQQIAAQKALQAVSINLTLPR